MAVSAGAVASSGPMVQITGVQKYYGTLHVLRGVDLEVSPGEVVA